jgi:hypothetical protein
MTYEKGFEVQEVQQNYFAYKKFENHYLHLEQLLKCCRPHAFLQSQQFYQELADHDHLQVHQERHIIH